MSLIDSILKKNAAIAPAAAIPNGETYVPRKEMKEAESLPAPPFPLHVLPKKYRDIVEDCARYLSYPKDFTAASMVAATSVAIGRTHDFTNGIWHEGGCVYLALVAPPGTMKSHPLSFAMHPITEENKKTVREYNRQRSEIAASGNPGTPEDKQMIYGDFTIETLMRGLKKNPRGVAVYLDELRAWIQNFNRYNAGSEQEIWLMNWSGSQIPINRSNYKSILERTDIPVVGTIQPSLLEDIGKGGRAQNGFVERMLFCYPDYVPVVPLTKRKQRTSDVYHVLLRRYIPLVQQLLDYNLLQEGDLLNDEERHPLICDEDAEDALIDFLNALKTRMEVIDNEFQRNIYSKMQTYACRFTMLLHLMHQAANELPKDDSFPPKDYVNVALPTVEKACELTEYFLKHALKAQDQISAATPLDRLPKNIRNWYSAIPSGTEISTSQVEDIAFKFGISRAAMFSYLNCTDMAKKLFIRTRHGMYEKIYHK